MTDTNPPAGWFPDPTGAPQNRWWNGVQWGDAIQPMVEQPLAVPPLATQPFHEQPKAQPVDVQPLAAQTPAIAAGWYPDPEASHQNRWWDGNAWHSATQQPAALTAAPQSAELVLTQPHIPTYSTVVAADDTLGHTDEYRPMAGFSSYSSRSSYGSTSPSWPTSADHMNPSTPHIWAIVIMYAVMSIGAAIYVYVVLSDPLVMLANETAYLTGQFGLGAVGLIAWIVAAVLAYRDGTELSSRGVTAPFHWAFTLIPSYGPTIYIIGRSVVARRRTGTGLAPLWVHIITSVGGAVLSVAAAFVAFSSYSTVY